MRKHTKPQLKYSIIDSPSITTQTLGGVFLFTTFVILVALAVIAPVTGAGKASAHSGILGAQPSTPLFSPVVHYNSPGRGSASVAVADLNGDGKPDLVVASILGGPLGVLLGNGDGTFQTAVGTGGPAFSVAVADLNGDGKPDLVVTTLTSTIGVLLGNGDGSFGPEVPYPSGGFVSTAVAISDVNGDGRPDLVVTNEEGQVFGGLVDVLLGNGDGTFQPAVTYPSGGGDAWSIVVADVNGDGKADLIVANVCDISSCTHGAVTVLLGNGNGAFATAATYDSGGIQAFSVAVADVNGDGKLDIAVVNGQSDNVGVLVGNGDGTFQPAVTYPAGGSLGEGAHSLALADVNGDGEPDLVLAYCNSNQNGCVASHGLVGIFLGNGDGTFQPVLTYGSGGFDGWGVVASDINGDGKPDVLVANYCGATYCTNGSVGVLLSAVQSSTSLTSILNPSIYGQKVTWTATVTSSGSITPTGKVNFTWSGHTIGSATLNGNGVAILTKNNLNVGNYPLVAVYLGGGANLRSTSAVLNQVVLQTKSTASLTSSPNPSTQGQTVTFTAKISSPTVKPTGPVTFAAGKIVLGTSQLSGGRATLTTSALPLGATKVTATYYGDSNISKSLASVTQNVQ